MMTMMMMMMIIHLFSYFVVSEGGGGGVLLQLRTCKAKSVAFIQRDSRQKRSVKVVLWR